MYWKTLQPAYGRRRGTMGLHGPVVIITREDAKAPRALSVTVPLTTENRGTKYEVQLPRVPWLRHQSFANVQAIAAYEYHELIERRGRFDAAVMGKIKDAVRWALDL